MRYYACMPFTSIKNFDKPDGSTDWAAYHKAQVANGESCSKCNAFILLGDVGHPQRCHDCQNIDTKPGEVEHRHSVRCPKCQHIIDPFEYESGIDLGEAMSGGEGSDIDCPECDTEFRVGVRVEYYFTSPPLVGFEDKND